MNMKYISLSIFFGLFLLNCVRPDCSVKAPNISVDTEKWVNHDVSDLGWLAGTKSYEPYQGGSLYIQKIDLELLNNKKCEICVGKIQNDIFPIAIEAFNKNITTMRIAEHEQNARYVASIKVFQVRTYPISGVIPTVFGYVSDDYSFWLKIVDKNTGKTVFAGKQRNVNFDKKTNELVFYALAKSINSWIEKT